ncbi:MFS general substrate transporter [Gyrodon lividus]|nr:MFS general substrate transporter [Gyrodon lividus]
MTSLENQVHSEDSPLLGDFPGDGQSSRSRPVQWLRFSPATLLIPVALVTKLASQLPVTTFVDLVRQVVCKFWHVSHSDPTALPADGSIPMELCDVPQVERYFSIVIVVFSVMDGISTMVGCGVLNHFASRYGRKPALLFEVAAGAMGCSLIIVSQFTPDWPAAWLIFAGILLQSLSNPFVYAYLINLYIVDVSAADDRTAALSATTGWATLGTCVSFALGGFVTTKTHNPLIVYYLAAALFVTTFTYVAFVLPESFPKDKRDKLRRLGQERSDDGSPTSTHGSFLLLVLEPLKSLIPSHASKGTHNWRLFWCAVHILIVTTANSYAAGGWLVIVTTKYHFTSVQTGLFLTIASTSSVFILTVIVPPLIRFLRPFYKRQPIRLHSASQHPCDDAGPLESETSDRLDVHMTFVSWLIGAISYLCAAASTTNQGLVVSAICIGFSIVHVPTIRSLVAGSVDPPKQGEALAAIEMVSSIGACLSPVIMGSILTATITTTPLLMFYVHLVVVVVGSAVLFLVRDSDRYQNPRDE